MATAKLLVCSVFGGGEFDKFWLDLQRQQLSRTVGDFDHAVYLSHRAEREHFKPCIVVGNSAVGDKSEHLDGLRALAAFCQQNSYSGYLVLDSDAFPIAPNWEETMQYYIHRFNRRYAAAVRTENLDAFPHPCVTYTRDPHALRFGYKPGINLLGQPITDITCLDGEFFPLLKTNRLTVHPVLATIYFDMFYHHGCGSRVFATRATNIGYYDQILERSADSQDLLMQLQADPSGFIANLNDLPVDKIVQHALPGSE
jgi:hypothetical protein